MPLKQCKVDGCDDPHKARGFCRKHYLRVRRSGSAEIEPFKAEWVKSNVGYIGDDCLIYPFGKNAGGYGSLTHLGVKQSASRLMCSLVHGDRDESFDARHKCANKACCNPSHLEWGSRSENMRDKARDGTDNRGTKNPLSRLTDSQVREIYGLRGGMSQRQIASKFGVSQRTVFSILHGEKWAWLTQVAAMPQEV